jgi:hypothetical protein
MQIADHLRSLEEHLLNPVVRHNPEAVSALLADDFLEFGGSGRVFDKASILEDLKNEPSRPASLLTDFKTRDLAPNVILATYKATTLRPQATTIITTKYHHQTPRFSKTPLKKPSKTAKAPALTGAIFFCKLHLNQP